MESDANADEHRPAAGSIEPEESFRLLFENNPLPMWVYDLETLLFLEVNDAAVAGYGYRREEFLQMRIADIRPAEDIAALVADVQRPRPDLQRRARWRHRRKDGTLLDVEISSHTLRFQGRRAALVVAQDVTELRQAERDRALLAAIVESSTDAIISKMPDGTITSWNAGAERLLGYTADEAIGQSILMLFPPDRYEEETYILDRVRRGERIEDFETIRRTKSGQELAVSLSISPVRDAEGQVVGVSKILRDITQRKQAEAALRESEARFRSVVTNAPVVLVVLDPDGVYTLSEGQGLAGLGFAPGEMVGQSVFDLYADYPDVIREVRAGLAGKSGRWTTTVNGIVFDAHSAPVFDAEGRVTSLVIVATDVTERERAQAERAQLLEEEQMARAEADHARRRLELLYQTMSSLLHLGHEASFDVLAEALVPELADWCALHIAGEDGGLKRVAVVHRDPQQVARVPAPPAPYAPGPDVPMGPAHVFETGEAELYPEVPDALFTELVETEAQAQWIRSLGLTSALIVPLAARGRTFGVLTLTMAESRRRFGEEDLILAEDLAQRAALVIDNARLFEAAHRTNAELEARVRERTAQLEAANQELESFSYSVSHDLRSPLRAIEGFTRILVERHADALDERATDYLQRVRRNALRMGDLIDDLLQFSRLSRKELQRESVNPRPLVEQVLDELGPEGSAARVEIGELPTCRADPALLKQVFANLLSNALKFSQYRERAVVRVGAECREGETVYAVADNGTGFDMRYADKLFGVFQRLHRVEEYEGTGVGLAIVQRIVHRHGGEVWAEAEPDRGATFYFTIPAP